MRGWHYSLTSLHSGSREADIVDVRRSEVKTRVHG